MAKILKANGEVRNVKPANGTDFSLEELQAVVGGYIEIVKFSDGHLLVCNEEGKLMGLELNPNASAFCQVRGRREVIVGDVLICMDNEIK